MTRANQAVKVAKGEVSLPSFRDGIVFVVLPLKFGGMKAVGRVEADPDSIQVDVMDTTLFEVLKRSFPDVTHEELDDIDQPDITLISEAIGEVNGDDTDFTPPNSTPK